jgi:hypothetical protein
VFSYVAYGLGIHSVVPLPELIERDVPADVIVHLGQVDHAPLEAVDASHEFWATAGDACHFFRGVGAFLVRSGWEIIVDPVPDTDPRAVRLSILGPALALVLLQRGRLVLHASAVAVAGSVIAFLGGQGGGKSTTAAALNRRGHDLVTDDVLVIHMHQGSPLAVPSFPQFKLWPASVVALGDVPEAYPLLHPHFDKRARRVTQGFAPMSLPLAHLYVLDEGPTLQIAPLQPQEALRELLRHWYGARFGRQLLQARGVASHFLQCACLINHVRICRLQRPARLSALSELARFVEADLAHAL